MRPVSSQFREVVRGSHKMRAEAIVVTGHQTGVNPVGTVIPILTGDVVSDSTADIRSTLDLTTHGDFPDATTDLFAPYGQEVFVRRGIEYGDRSVEWVSLGYYRIDGASQDDAPLGEISITGSDRMAGIVDARLLAPLQFVAGTSVEHVFESLITEVYPAAQIEFDFDASAVVLNRATVVEEERYEFLRDLANAQAKDFYVRYDGKFVIQDRPDPSEALFEIASGRDGVLVSMSREISREGVYNAVVASGEGADEVDPVRAVARDMNPKSPTFWNGPFGKIPRFYSSPFVTSTAQAQSAARKILTDNLGLPFSLSFGSVPAVFLEPNDPVRVMTNDHDYVHVLQSVTIPLTADTTMNAKTRDLTSIQIGIS